MRVQRGHVINEHSIRLFRLALQAKHKNTGTFAKYAKDLDVSLGRRPWECGIFDLDHSRASDYGESADYDGAVTLRELLRRALTAQPPAPKPGAPQPPKRRSVKSESVSSFD
jgi:hypothetical protein